MTENQFIHELEMALSQLPAEERNDILQDIREYFFEGREDGKTDSEISASLGLPAEIAKDLLASYSFAQNEVNVEGDSEVITIHENLFTKVDINVNHGALILQPSHNTVTTVELIGKSDKLQLTAEVIGDTLDIRLKNLRHWLFMFAFNMRPITLTVSIPKKLYDSIRLKTDNGRISAEKLLGKNINAQSDNGRIQLREIAASTLIAETDNGRIDVNKIEADHAETKTDNGRIEMRYIKANNISTESDNGRILLEHVESSIVGSTDNGRITLQTDHIDRNIDFRTDNGSITIQSRVDPTNVSIHAKTNHGRVDIFGERNSRTVYGAGENVIRLKSGNGRITVV